MRQVVGVLAGALLAVVGAVVLGEYDLQGVTAVVGFPLYGVAVAELTLAIGRRLGLAALAAVAVVVVAGLAWALWISFSHFRNGLEPPTLSWVMVVVAATAAVTWARSGRRRHPAAHRPVPPQEV